jgi:hypothetical protein
MPNGIGNRATWPIGTNPDMDTGRPIDLKIYPNLLEFGSNVGMGKDDTSAINAAIASLTKGGGAGINGGTIYVPPPPSLGNYVHEGPINLKELTDVRLIGSGGHTANALGVGKPISSSVFLYTGTGGRAWDFRSSVGCGLENIHCFAQQGLGTNPIWDCSGTEAKPCALAHFINAGAETTTTTGTLPHAIGVSLDFANECAFDSCNFASCQEAVLGRTAGGNSSVGHSFWRCMFVGSQKIAIANPHEAWSLDSCVAESLFNDKGVLLKQGGFIGYTGIGLLSHGLNLTNCWTGSNTASRIGTNVEFRGEGLNISGGSYNTAEVAVAFPEGSIGSTIMGTRLWQVNVGILNQVGEILDSCIAFNRYLEVIAPFQDTSGKAAKGSIIQEGNGLALKVS